MPAQVVGQVTWYGRICGGHHAGVGRARDADVLKGVNMSLRRELWRLDSPLRGEGVQIHMEVGVCLQARRDGWRLIYDPEAQVDHYPAARFFDDDRDHPTQRARANVEWNHAYVMARYLVSWQVPFAALYMLLVGTRSAPGLVTWAERCARSPRSLPETTQLLRTLTPARISGVRAGIAARIHAR